MTFDTCCIKLERLRPCNGASCFKVTGYSRARARRLREYSYNVMVKNGNYEPTFFLAKNKNEDSDLGWTADLKISLDKL